MQHGGGHGWMSGGMLIMVLAAIVLVGLVVWYRRRKGGADEHSWKILRRAFAPLIAYDSNQMSSERARSLAKDLWQLHVRVWNQCNKTYGHGAADAIKERQRVHIDEFKRKFEDLEPVLSRVVLNANLTEDGKPKVIKLYRRAGHIHMRPTGTERMYLLFALEVHQLYRAWAFGMDKYGKPKDDPDAVILWDRMIEHCRREAGRFA
jgi:hypothetical protein